MSCEHKRIMSRNCVLYCADCGAMLPAQCAAGGEPEMAEPPTRSASGSRIGVDAEKKPRRARGKGKEI